ncbi:hypothetical protein GCM10011518_33720 [Flavobacterium limi]|uniref:Uncharacterized protein n=1 Tax=Flavobacterium limi TaxID=2045105 RepID=A0ABQ1ULB2_9FLAO|nr:hypothetical protein GCM10011518_33720 [Flavobacterium limi]
MSGLNKVSEKETTKKQPTINYEYNTSNRKKECCFNYNGGFIRAGKRIVKEYQSTGFSQLFWRRSGNGKAFAGR